MLDFSDLSFLGRLVALFIREETVLVNELLLLMVDKQFVVEEIAMEDDKSLLLFVWEQSKVKEES